jgi:DNA polymerase-3 subunit epsilon
MVELGAVELVGNQLSGRSLHAFFDPGIEVSLPMQEDHGLNAAFLAGFPQFADVANRILAFFEGAEFISMNDICKGYLDNELSLHGFPAISFICPKTIETFGMFRQRFSGYPRDDVRRTMRVLHGFDDKDYKPQRCIERAFFVAKAYQWMTSNPAGFDHL